jgi:hypothetical protein
LKPPAYWLPGVVSCPGRRTALLELAAVDLAVAAMPFALAVPLAILELPAYQLPLG